MTTDHDGGLMFYVAWLQVAHIDTQLLTCRTNGTVGTSMNWRNLKINASTHLSKTINLPESRPHL